ncbi:MULTISPECIES: nuclear transport factor 2 family protein [Streptomycetaceae]|uniref:SnoaL-like domain-containing protein n=1 Tax=Streptantibioticus cattleyicolor (strain ATCC 35852 / DSM 46488 / JCM 4925 / NBRC 14057 / NRRL 8057) TaxID=1003195 RepID=F8K2X4_STREN|nr:MULTISPECIES: nuclear transport factor 2 family protein [Streptomycetaceae]AEW92459.1 hypothetical protein SCATT_00880 [Streptantibioticus cattleyicolor NRRL 8057 = DSM 46488]MYS57266.1 nuclear transport factor 2 family protein [Streptomyces sp. SID5468]CCB72823.1 conserved protein of unknown function [Streptantibioticus cattleyicolor NRRL 8057 = DSM 46488]
MPTVQNHAELTLATVEDLARRWYRALDRHDPLEEVVPFLVRDGLVMRFPEGTVEGLAGFADWYETVTHRFFDEAHEVRSVAVLPMGPAIAEVKVVVNWQASVWSPPAPQSRWLGFDAHQTWTVVLDGGSARIRGYTVDALEPMPGSAVL